MIQSIENLCKRKQDFLLEKYFGPRYDNGELYTPETIEEYTKDLPLKIQAEYRTFLQSMWQQYGYSAFGPLVMEERKLSKLMTDDDRELIEDAYKDATRRTLWERITKSNNEDVTYYKGLLSLYTRDLLTIDRLDFMEEIKNHPIKNKTFEDEE